MTDSGRIAGTVKWFSNEKGYGFITPNEGSSITEDIFVHQSCIHSEGYRTLVSTITATTATTDADADADRCSYMCKITLYETQYIDIHVDIDIAHTSCIVTDSRDSLQK